MNINRIPDDFIIPSPVAYQINQPFSEVLDVNGKQTANATVIEFDKGTSLGVIRKYMKEFITLNFELINDSYELTLKGFGFDELL